MVRRLRPRRPKRLPLHRPKARRPTTALASAAFPRTIKHTRGELTLNQPAQRVIALEWTYVEDLLALGVQPVGVADIEGYNDWVKIPVALGDGVKDIGVRGEPNLETIATLKPDLIIDLADNAVNYAELSKIAPVLSFEPYPTDPSLSQYDEMRETLLKIAARPAAMARARRRWRIWRRSSPQRRRSCKRPASKVRRLSFRRRGRAAAALRCACSPRMRWRSRSLSSWA